MEDIDGSSSLSWDCATKIENKEHKESTRVYSILTGDSVLGLDCCNSHSEGGQRQEHGLGNLLERWEEVKNTKTRLVGVSIERAKKRCGRSSIHWRNGFSALPTGLVKNSWAASMVNGGQMQRG